MAMDPRSLGMGGTGVSSATSASAVFYNPALLSAAKDGEDFALEIPALTLRVADPDDFWNDYNDLINKRYFERFSDAFVALFPANGSRPASTQFETNRQNLVVASEQLRDALLKVSNKTVEVNSNGGVVVGIPSKRYGIALMINAWGGAGAYAEISDADLIATNDLIEGTRTLNYIDFLTRTDPTQNFSTFVAGRAGVFGEVGVGLARQFSARNQTFAAGITPKLVQTVTYDYHIEGRTLDTTEFQINHAEKQYTSFNFDAGFAKDYGNAWKTGLAIKNVIPQRYKTVLGNNVDVRPQARIGGSHHTERTTVAVDLDLNPSDPVGFGEKTQYLGIGGELDIWLLLVRLGFRHNLADPTSSIVTLGLGLNVFGLHFDAAAGVSPGLQEINGAAQLGFRF